VGVWSGKLYEATGLTASGNSGYAQLPIGFIAYNGRYMFEVSGLGAGEEITVRFDQGFLDNDGDIIGAYSIWIHNGIVEDGPYHQVVSGNGPFPTNWRTRWTVDAGSPTFNLDVWLVIRGPK
jgi:hypothetical protein